MSGRLQGVKLLLTRSADDAGPWIAQLRAEGAEPIVLPCIASETIADPTLGVRLSGALKDAGWLILTSRRGVDTAAALLNRELPSNVEVATVGAVTAARVAETFGRVAHTGRGTGLALAQELVAAGLIGAGSQCVLALAANASDAVERTLREAGANVTRFDIYRTIPAPLAEPRPPVSTFGCTAVIFASPSAVAGFDNQVNVDTAIQMVTIGPSTSDAVRERHWPVAAEAKEPGLTGIIEAMLETGIV